MKKRTRVITVLLIIASLGLIGTGAYNLISFYLEKKSAEDKSAEVIKEFEDSLKDKTTIDELPVEEETDDLDAFKDGRVVGVMTIEAMGVHWPIAMGVTNSTLYQYIGMYKTHGTIGKKGQNAGFAAHSCRNGACAVASFDRMEDKLKKGDIVEILWQDGKTYRYSVYEVLPYQDPNGDFFDVEPDQELITLVTCTKGDSTYRTVVHASRIYDGDEVDSNTSSNNSD